MFDNIGGKIKGLARFVCWAGIIISAIYALILWTSPAGQGNSGSAFLTGLMILAIGGLASWVGSFFVYGFGELIERAVSIDEQMKRGGTTGKGTPVKNAKKPSAGELLRWLDDGLITEEEFNEQMG